MSSKRRSTGGEDTDPHGYLRGVRLLRDRVERFDVYPYSIPAIRGLEELPLDRRVTIFIGENGSGKSTLLEAIAILAGFNPEGGSKHLRFAVRPSESSLSASLRLVRGVRREKSGFFLRAETFFNLATAVEAPELAHYGWVNLHARSHGEAFLWLSRERFRPKGLYLLDEPESALSPQRQLGLLRLIHDLTAAESQFVIATHSPLLMAYPGALLYQFSSRGITPVKFEETEHYLVTRDFLADPARWFRHLFAAASEEPDPAPGEESSKDEGPPPGS